MSRFVKRFGLSFTIALAMFIARSAQAQCLSPPLETATLTSEEDGAVFVQWLGPIGVCPQLGDDFTVSVEGSGPLAPASITLKTLVKDGVPVQEYRVGRKRYEPLPGNFITRDLGKVDTVWSGGQNDGIIVRIGTVADYPVAVLQGVVTPEHPEGLAVDIAAPGSVGGNNPWSSVEIQTVGDVKGSVFAYANTNLEGGRIRGVIGTGGGGSQGLPGQNGDDQPKIDVQGIGEGIGGGTPGSPIVLRVTGNIWNMRLKELGEGSRLEAGGMTSSSGIGGLLNIRGPLDGVIRLGSLSGTGGPQPTKIHVEALGAGGAPAESHGKIIIAGGDLSDVSFFPCDQCNTSGWTADAGTWGNAEVAIDSDFSGKIYAWTTALADQTNLHSASLKIGRSMTEGMRGNLKPGAEIRTFQGNHSSPPVEAAIAFIHVEVFGDTEGDTLDLDPPPAKIDFAGQLGQQEYINIYGDHHGITRVMYFYGSYGPPAANSQVHVYKNHYGLIESANLTDFAFNGGFRDNGTITIEGDVKPGAQIRHTGHVGPQHLTDVKGNFDGVYWGFGSLSLGGTQKKYAGTLHVHGNYTGQIEVTSMDSMNFNSFTQMKGGALKIDGDMVGGTIKLHGVNDPPCRWLCPDISPYTPSTCECACSACGSPPCVVPHCCAGEFRQGCLDEASCATACGCLDSDGHAPSTLCDEQSNVARENGIQHPGALVDGAVTIAGKVTAGGTIVLYGDIAEHGSIRIGSLEGGSIQPQSTFGIRSGGSITVSRGLTYGSIVIPGDMGGTITVGSLGPPPSGQSASITVGGKLTGALSVNGVMKDALIDLNTVLQDPLATTTGQVNIGTSSTSWTAVNGVIEIGHLNAVWGTGGLAKFRGCANGSSHPIIQHVCPPDPNHVVANFCTGVTPSFACP